MKRKSKIFGCFAYFAGNNKVFLLAVLGNLERTHTCVELREKIPLIRDLIAFPKTASAQDLMIDSPGEVDASQLKEPGIKSLNKTGARVMLASVFNRYEPSPSQRNHCFGRFPYYSGHFRYYFGELDIAEKLRIVQF